MGRDPLKEAIDVLYDHTTHAFSGAVTSKPNLDCPGRRSTSALAKGSGRHPSRIGPRAVGWPAQEVAALNAARIAGQSDAELRELVTRLHAARAVQTSSGQPNEGIAHG